MQIKVYVIDAFSEAPFTGNPAAVCLLDDFPEDALMQQIAAENNLAETAFVVRTKDQFRIRWFTPIVEVDLCGHATLASGHVLFNYTDFSSSEITFDSRSGPLKVTRKGDTLVLNFPADRFSETDISEEIVKGMGRRPEKIFRGKSDFMFVYNSQKEVESISPDFALIAKASARGIIVTAPGDNCDFVSRFFAPQSGINEDPVTGSAHTTLIPYWSEALGKTELTAKQISKRGGTLYCVNHGDRVEIGGKARTYLKGVIEV
jgi:PhzF family phenazine biosynthesis protein